MILCHQSEDGRQAQATNTLADVQQLVLTEALPVDTATHRTMVSCPGARKNVTCDHVPSATSRVTQIGANTQKTAQH